MAEPAADVAEAKSEDRSLSTEVTSPPMDERRESTWALAALAPRAAMKTVEKRIVVV